MRKEINVKDLKLRMDAGKTPTLLDVRESSELEICKLPYEYHIPVSEITDRINELSKDQELIVYCRSGRRSGNVVDLLNSQGFTKVANLEGGILAWADEIDNTMEKY